MLKNKKFAGYTVAFCILGVVFMFLYSGLQNDQINIIQNFTAWKNTDTQMPMTVGNFACIILTVIYGTCFIKFGVRKTLIPCIAISALGCLGIVAANGLACMNSEALTVASHATNDPLVTGNYILFWISLFAVRCACMCLQMAGFQLAASWFIRYRGRVLGIVTLGSPLFSLIGTSAMTTFITNNLGGDYRPFYVGLAVLLVVVAVLVVLFIRDTPEEVGLYPDGADHAPKSEAGDEIQLTMGEAMAGMGPAVLFVGQAVPWLSLGVLVGIGMSFIFGVIDDKLGTPIASLILGITEFFPVIGLMSQAKAVAETGSCNVPMLVLWGFGVACMTGGVPTMHPASVSFMFGRREYQSANRIIMAIQLIPSAVAAMMMTVLIDNGMGTLGYGILIAVVIFGIVTTLPMLKMRDANAEDRG